MSEFPFRRGDRVRETRTGETGVVHAVYPGDAEDNTEILLDSGIYTCRDYRRWQLVERFEPLRTIREGV